MTSRAHDQHSVADVVDEARKTHIVGRLSVGSHICRPVHRQCRSCRRIAYGVEMITEHKWSLSFQSTRPAIILPWPASSLPVWPCLVTRRCNRQLALQHVHADDPWIDLDWFVLIASATTTSPYWSRNIRHKLFEKIAGCIYTRFMALNVNSKDSKHEAMWACKST
jgi:hypothetical protein